MCGRYYQAEDKQGIAEYFRAELADPDAILPPGYNIPLTTTQPVIRESRDSGARELLGMCLGLVGFGSKGPDPERATFNARIEGLKVLSRARPAT